MKAKAKRYYLAYGSNMDLEQMASRCPDAKLVGRSEIPNYQLLFKGSKTGSYATIEPKKGSKVPVLIWEISESDERNLDRYEGFPTFYYKKDFTVNLPTGPVTAMAYIMDEKRPLGLPTLRYYDVLERAYEQFGFDMEVLNKALQDSIPW